MRKIELLSPAKDLACGIAAIDHGADAVYIGAPKFGARSAVGNSIEDIQSLTDYAHLFKAKVYVALNTILSDEELVDAEKIIHRIWNETNADALIIQDVGILELNLPPIPLHASTQMDNRTPEKVKFLEEVGFSQVVLARELSLSDIKNIKSQTTVPLEFFVHGALCTSYSGQCYISQALSNRSANRGQCAQYCRQLYDLEDADGNKIIQNKHLLSLKDLNLSQDLKKLIDAGISSFKIEGRLKDISYVKNITAFYRQQIDAVLAQRKDLVKASTGKTTLTFTPNPYKSFNRGFSTYFLHKKNSDVSSINTPKSIGEKIGVISSTGEKSFSVETTEKLHNGDGLVVFNSKGDTIGFRINSVIKNEIFVSEKINVKKGDVVYRNHDHAFEKALSKNSAVRKLDVHAVLNETQKGFSLSFTNENDFNATVDFPLAKIVALTPQQEIIRHQLSRLGYTPFHLASLSINYTENWLIPSSVLADARRRVVEKLLCNITYVAEKSFIKPTTIRYPEKGLSYLGNIHNEKAKIFYKSHGVTRTDPSFEKKKRFDVPVMFCKYCILSGLDACKKQQKNQAFKEPLFLVTGNNRLRLEFDCKACEMRVYR